MDFLSAQSETHPRVVQTHLLGQIDYSTCLALQRRLIYEKTGEADPPITILVCEHPDSISIGRLGSRAHIHLGSGQMTRRGLKMFWVSRGGGCILHAPGQLAVYPLVPLANCGWSVGEYLSRLQTALVASLRELGVATSTVDGRTSIWGRRGVMAAVGAAVRSHVTYHGFYLNVAPAKSVFGYVDVDYRAQSGARNKSTQSSLLAERGRGAKMTEVRTTVLDHLTTAFQADRHTVFSGHPLLESVAKHTREFTARAS